MGGCRMANSIIFIAEFDYKIKIGGLVQTTTKIARRTTGAKGCYFLLVSYKYLTCL